MFICALWGRKGYISEAYMGKYINGFLIKGRCQKTVWFTSLSFPSPPQSPNVALSMFSKVNSSFLHQRDRLKFPLKNMGLQIKTSEFYFSLLYHTKILQTKADVSSVTNIYGCLFFFLFSCITGTWIGSSKQCIGFKLSDSHASLWEAHSENPVISQRIYSFLSSFIRSLC